MLSIDGIPYDGEPIQDTVEINPVLTVLMILLAAAGAKFAIACMIFNFINRKRRLVGNYIQF